jgi:hypothetical protein
MKNGDPATAMAKALHDKKVRVYLYGLEGEDSVATKYVVGRISGSLPGIVIMEFLFKKDFEKGIQRKVTRYIPYEKIITADTAEELEINYNEDNDRDRGVRARVHNR